LSSSLALSLLRNSAPPNESVVLSPASLDTALAMVLDGTGGTTQAELTNLLLNGCSPSDVAAFYSSLSLSLLSTNASGITIKGGNRVYLDETISVKPDYKKHVESAYKAEFEEIEMSKKGQAANSMNSFAKALVISTLYFYGKWKLPFNPSSTRLRTFHGVNGDIQV
ncbi:hypothetical protein PMAYCL1PPCAC_27139, partial [Pristionchus mayeri]